MVWWRVRVTDAQVGVALSRYHDWDTMQRAGGDAAARQLNFRYSQLELYGVAGGESPNSYLFFDNHTSGY